MTHEQYIRNAMKHSVEEFPQECWDQIWDVIRSEGFAGLTKRENLAELSSCFFLIAAYAAHKIFGSRVIGGTQANDISEDERRCHDKLQDLQSVQVPMTGPVADFFYHRLLALAVSYAISIAQDDDRVQEIFNQVIEWIRNQLNE